MIVFKTLRFSNFLSSGNNVTEIQFDKAKHTLIVGHNGAGKSTMLDALSFALFGKAHRNINKPQLVNSINKKNCLVEVEFTVGSGHYKIVRGLNPGIFEIWKNGEMINQSSHSKEYQKILEQNIIKLNHKSFHQIVVLGSSSFIPFMQLPQGTRRDVIEDLLDIGVFSKMNYLLRERNGGLKDEIKDTNHKVDVNDARRDAQKKHMRDLTALNTSHRKEKEDLIVDYQAQIDALHIENGKLTESIIITRPVLDEQLKRSHDRKQSLLQAKGQLNIEIKYVVDHAKFYDTNDACPTCSQEIDAAKKASVMQAAKAKAKHLSIKKSQLEADATVVDEAIATAMSQIQAAVKIQTSINNNIQSITHIQKTISQIESEIVKLSNASSDLAGGAIELERLDEIRSELVDLKFKLTEEYAYNSAQAEMLKDTGIKTKVIKQYLPVINKLVNQYLQVLDFFVLFQLDESFTEEIRSRHRDSFSYASFSEGEKQRIDLALLFTWRQIAKMKNSVATNLLILDETFDSSLDHDGVENLMKILYTLDDDTNVFVISHKGEILEGKFEQKIEFFKDKNFSCMK